MIRIAFLSGSQPISVRQNAQKNDFDQEEYSRVPIKPPSPHMIHNASDGINDNLKAPPFTMFPM